MDQRMSKDKYYLNIADAVLAVRVSFSIALMTGMTRMKNMPVLPESSIGASISGRRRVYASKLSPSTGYLSHCSRLARMPSMMPGTQMG